MESAVHTVATFTSVLGTPSLGWTWLHVTFYVCSISGISNAEARQPGKAPNFSVNWTVGDSTIEVINATTGKDELGRASRLCKHALYCRWMRVHGKVLRCPPRRYAGSPPHSVSVFIPPVPPVVSITMSSHAASLKRHLKISVFLKTVFRLNRGPWLYKCKTVLMAASSFCAAESKTHHPGLLWKCDHQLCITMTEYL